MSDSIDHDFERALEGMDEQTVRDMFYTTRSENERLRALLLEASGYLSATKDAEGPLKLRIDAALNDE